MYDAGVVFVGVDIMNKRNALLVGLGVFLLGGVVTTGDYIQESISAYIVNAIRITDGTTEWNIDSDSGAGVVIDSVQEKIHSGNHYIMDTVDYDVDTATNGTILIITPDDKRLHIVFAGSCSTGSTFEFFENTTTSANGTAITTINNYRGSASSSSLWFNTPTITLHGEKLLVGYLGVGEGKKSSGTGSGRDAQLILYPSTYYLLNIHPTADDTIATLSVTWYEVDIE